MIQIKRYDPYCNSVPIFTDFLSQPSLKLELRPTRKELQQACFQRLLHILRLYISRLTRHRRMLRIQGHTWKKEFKMPFGTVVVGNFTILPTSMLMVNSGVVQNCTTKFLVNKIVKIPTPTVQKGILNFFILVCLWS